MSIQEGESTPDPTGLAENLMDLNLNAAATDKPDATEPENFSPKKDKKPSRKGKRGGKKQHKKAAKSDSSSLDSGLTSSEQPTFTSFNGFDNTKSDTHTEELFVFGQRSFTDTDGGEHGLFAKTHILAGTRIISEPPILALIESQTDSEGVYAAFQKLSESRKQEVLDLRSVEQEVLLGHRDEIAQLIEDAEILEKKNERTEEESTILKAMKIDLDTKVLKYRLAAIFMTNAVSLRLQADPKGIPPNVPVTGLFPTAARLNHSCIPNVFMTWNSRIKRVTVHATRDIHPRDELTCSYIGTKTFFFPAEERRRLLVKWAFKCMCPACDTNHSAFEEHDANRCKLYTNQEYMDFFFSKRVEHPNPSASTPSRKTHTDPPTQYEYLLAEQTILDTIDVLRQEGCTDMELARQRKMLAVYVLPDLGKWTAALAHAKTTLLIAERCIGTDNPDIEETRKSKEMLGKKVEDEKRATKRR
ncbi:SET domain-containing protein [Zopfia rhizophila CBS 207.26]|uniref:SET domain-containing protein n=1 Tax=Zopfia rhizophila CBS 207.26 TaxID=1314779 RepID=A0A6A6E916_9PEZI|nr:SET domain-containing protein [Zopfia rhizophila CBS 207.26]